MKTIHILLLAILVAMAACVPTTQVSATRITLTPQLQQKTQALATQDLIDPGSAQYRGLRAWRLSNGDIAVCGEQNGRNRFGGYAGFRALYLRFTDSTTPSLSSLKREFVAQTACDALDRGQGLPIAE